jgi:hypothetical protein
MLLTYLDLLTLPGTVFGDYNFDMEVCITWNQADTAVLTLNQQNGYVQLRRCPSPPSVSIQYGSKTFKAKGQTIGDIKIYILEREGIPVSLQILEYGSSTLENREQYHVFLDNRE